MFFARQLFIFGQRALLHDVPDGASGVSRDDIVWNHLIIYRMRLKLDALSTSIGNIVNHLDGPSDVTAVVDANFWDHERSKCIANLARCDC